MTKKQTSTTIKVKSGVRAGGLPVNHSRNGLKVRTAVKAGGLPVNHNRGMLQLG